MEKYIYINKKSLSTEICRDIIDLFENEDRKSDGITHGGLQKNIKDTKDFVIPENEPKWYNYYQLFHNEIMRNLQLYLNKLNENDSFKNINQNTTSNYTHFNNIKISHSVFMIQRYIMNTGRYVYHNDFKIDIKDSIDNFVSI